MADHRATQFWVVLYVCLLHAITGVAQAPVQRVGDGGPVVLVHGVQISVPAGFRALPEMRLPGVEQVFRDDQELSVFVLRPAPADAKNAASTAGFSPQRYARGYAESLRSKLGLNSVGEAQAVMHDARRGAVRMRFRVNGASQAAMLFGLDDAHSAWDPLRRQGVDRTQIRCLITALLGDRNAADEAELRARYDTAAQRCGRTSREVATFVDHSKASFAPVASVIEAITFFARSASVHVLVLGPESRMSAAAEVADQLWQSARVLPVARPDVSIFAALTGASRFDAGRLIGVVLGAIVAVFGLGAVFGWAFAKGVGLAPKRAVQVALLMLFALALLGSLGTGGISLTAGVQLAAYATVSAFALRPLARWVARVGANNA